MKETEACLGRLAGWSVGHLASRSTDFLVSLVVGELPHSSHT